jgi:hypothetical protein
VLHESGKYIKREIPKEASEFWKIDGRQNAVAKLNQMLCDAKSSVNYLTSGPGLIRTYKVHSETLESEEAGCGCQGSHTSNIGEFRCCARAF